MEATGSVDPLTVSAHRRICLLRGFRKRGTGSNFAAFAKLRACTVFARVRIILLEINDAIHEGGPDIESRRIVGAEATGSDEPLTGPVRRRVCLLRGFENPQMVAGRGSPDSTGSVRT